MSLWPVPVSSCSTTSHRLGVLGGVLLPLSPTTRKAHYDHACISQRSSVEGGDRLAHRGAPPPRSASDRHVLGSGRDRLWPWLRGGLHRSRPGRHANSRDD